MTRRPPMPPDGNIRRAHQRMAPGGRLWSESPVRGPAVRVVAAGDDPEGYGWTQQPVTDDIYATAYGDGLWWGLGNDLYTSPDGITWTSAGNNNVPGFRFAYGAGVWVTAGDSGGLWTATDPTGAWTPRTSGTAAHITAIVYAAGMWALGTIGGEIIYTTDPTGAWTTSPNIPDVNSPIGGIASDGNVWVLAIDQSPDIPVYTAPTVDGLWTARVHPFQFGGAAAGLAYAAGTWVAASDFNDDFGHTTDPTGAWTPVTPGFGPGTTVLDLRTGGGVWVAVGGSGSLATATDPTTSA